MQDSLKNLPPSIAYFAQRSHQPTPIQNVFVPDPKAIRKLKAVLSYYEHLKPPDINYGTSSSYRKHPVPPAKGEPIQFNRVDDLPLFRKREP